MPFCIVFGADGGVRYKGDPSKIDFATVFDAPAASEEAVTSTCAKGPGPLPASPGQLPATPVRRRCRAWAPQPHSPLSRESAWEGVSPTPTHSPSHLLIF